MRCNYFCLVCAFASIMVGRTTIGQDVHVRIELVEVHCGNTEDVSGSDDFFVVGAFTTNGKDTKSVITTPIHINDKENKPFSESERVVFDGNLPANESVRGFLTAFDEDAAADWKKHKEDLSKISTAISGLLTSSGNPYAMGAAALVKGAYEAADLVVPLDKDDNLGKKDFTIPATGKSNETLEWNTEKKASNILGKFSDWEYTVKYRVIRTKS